VSGQLKTRYVYYASIYDVYDGDSVTVDVDLGMGVWLNGQKMRLLGINSPELRGDTRQEGIAAREFLVDLIKKYSIVPGKMKVVIKTYKDKKGKYGRWLCEIVGRNHDTGSPVRINRAMIEGGHAVPY
jgi:micrococcal nuclease